MKKLLALLLLILVACVATPPAADKVTRPAVQAETQVSTQEQVTSPAQDKIKTPAMEEEEVTGTPVEPTGWEHDPYSQLGCELLLEESEFAKECSQEITNLVVTYKIGTKNCFVNVKDRLNERLTAGVTVTGYDDAETAEKEFDRRLVVLKVGADQSIGERAYEMPNPAVDRVESYFLRNEFIVKIGTDTRLCSQDGMLSVGRIVDSRLK